MKFTDRAALNAEERGSAEKEKEKKEGGIKPPHGKRKRIPLPLTARDRDGSGGGR
jgi:hypothetical protein